MLPFQHFFNTISPLTAATWDAIQGLFRADSLTTGDYFVRADEVGREIAFLESGVVRAFFTNAKGQEYNKQFFVGPALIGAYTSLLTGKPNLIPQQALTDAVIWRCDFAALTAHFQQYHDLERLARKVAEYYFLEKEKKELEIVLQDASQRYRIFQEEFPGLEQQIPQYHIASYLGISATQLSRIRRAFAGK